MRSAYKNKKELRESENDRLSTDEFQDNDAEDGEEKGAVMEFAYEQSNDYKTKQRSLYTLRLEKARIWILIVFSYYLIRASIVIYPKYRSYDPWTQTLVITQSLIFLILFSCTMLTFKMHLDFIQWILYGQAILMSLSNFNGYDETDT